MIDSKYELMRFIDDNLEIRECMGVKSRTLEEILQEEKAEDINVTISIEEPVIRRIVSEKVARVGLKGIV